MYICFSNTLNKRICRHLRLGFFHKIINVPPHIFKTDLKLQMEQYVALWLECLLMVRWYVLSCLWDYAYTVKEPLLLIGKNSACDGSGFPLCVVLYHISEAM